MKRMLSLMILVLLVCSAGASGEGACSGMLALFSDQGGGGCSSNITYCEPVSMYLCYVRGAGPEITGGVGFRLLKSTTGALFLEPQWSGDHISFGSLESGIDLSFNSGAGWCSGAETVSYIGKIPVVNFTDPDTFTVRVVEQPVYSGIVVCECKPGLPLFYVTGGTFVFNGHCHSPEDPNGEDVAVASASWGAIKSLFR